MGWFGESLYLYLYYNNIEYNIKTVTHYTIIIIHLIFGRMICISSVKILSHIIIIVWFKLMPKTTFKSFFWLTMTCIVSTFYLYLYMLSVQSSLLCSEIKIVMRQNIDQYVFQCTFLPFKLANLPLFFSNTIELSRINRYW